jgi:phage baseplate assembly protein W
MAKTARLFTDIDAAFQAHPTTGDLLIRTNERAIKFAVKSLVLTSNYEKLFHSEIGTPIKQLLFENFDDMTTILIKESVADVISKYEPRVTVLNVAVQEQRDNNSIGITIVFKIKNTETPLSVDVVLERTR